MPRIPTAVLGFSLLAFAAAAHAAGANEQTQRQSAQPQPQQQSTQSMQSGNDQQSQGQQQGSQAASGGSQPSKQSAQSGNSISAERLQDAKVVDKNGQDLGEIEDVVIDLQKNRVHAVVLSFGGFLGVGDKQYAFPMSELKPARGDNRYTVNVDKQRLENAEGFAKGQLPGMDDEYWTRVGQGGRQNAQQQGQQKGQQAQGAKMHLVQASKIIGQEVQGKGGEQIGEVRDLLISRSDGQLRQLVIDVKDGGEARVPAKGLSAGTGDKLVLDMNADQVRAQASPKQSQRRGAVGGTVGVPPATAPETNRNMNR